MKQEATDLKRSGRPEGETEMSQVTENRILRKGGPTDDPFPNRENLIRHDGAAHADGIRVLHIVPYVYFYEDYKCLGSSKDIDGRQQYLRQSGVSFDTFCHLKDLFTLADEFSFLNLPDYTHIIVDLSKSVEDLKFLKRQWPNAKIIVRSHNPEVMHRLDNILATQVVASTRREKRSALLNLGIFLRRELGVAKYADSILHIETPNTARYWRALGFSGDVLMEPYFVSNDYIECVPHGHKRRKQIVCLGSSHPGPLITEMMINFHKATRALEGRRREFTFYATGEAPASLKEEDISPRVERLGTIDDVASLLSESFAVAVTSSLGRGFKTKILEAINCGAWVIASPGLMKRMPEILKPYCASLDRRNSGDSLAAAIDELSGRRWPAGDPNAALREDAYRALDLAIFGKPATAHNLARNTSIANLTARSVS